MNNIPNINEISKITSSKVLENKQNDIEFLAALKKKILAISQNCIINSAKEGRHSTTVGFWNSENIDGRFSQKEHCIDRQYTGIDVSSVWHECVEIINKEGYTAKLCRHFATLEGHYYAYYIEIEW